MGTYFHLLSAEVITLIDLFIPTSRESARRLANAAVKIRLIVKEYCSKCGENHQLPETCEYYNNRLRLAKAPVTWQAIGREGCMLTWVGFAEGFNRYEVDILHFDIEKYLNRPFNMLQLQLSEDDTVERFFHKSICSGLMLY